MADNEKKTNSEQPDVVKKPRRKIASLNDFRSLEFDAEITLDDEIVEIPCKMLTYARYQELGRMVPATAAPLSGADRNGRPIRNYDDPTWLAQRTQDDDRRMFYRITELVRFDIPGKTFDERVENMQKRLEPAVVIGLVKILKDQFNESEDAVASRAATFHNGGNPAA